MSKYTVQKITEKDKLYGDIHAMDNPCNTTVCGEPVDENWFILTNDGRMEALTCEACKNKLKFPGIPSEK